MEIIITYPDLVFADLFHIILIVGLYFLFSFFEDFFPAEKDHSIRGKLRNLFYTLMYLTLGGVLLYYVIQLFPISETQYDFVSLWYSFLVVIVYIFFGDFFYYWYHRAQHTFNWLWKIHELHHSDTELNVTTSMRTYFLERPIQYLVLSLPVFYVLSLTSLGDVIYLDQTAALSLAVIFTLWLFFTHTNIRFHLGFLTKVITGPQLHRIHHSIEEHHRDTNFAQFFPIYDILFGTYVHPGKNEYPKTGTPGLAVDATFFESTFKPLRDWLKITK